MSWDGCLGNFPPGYLHPLPDPPPHTHTQFGPFSMEAELEGREREGHWGWPAVPGMALRSFIEMQ